MPIISYLAYPKRHRGRALAGKLQSLPGCEVIPSGDHSLLVLVCDTKDQHSESELQRAFASLEDLESLAMVFAYDDSLDHPEGET